MVLTDFGIGQRIRTGPIIIPIKFQVYDEINNRVLYEYACEKNPSKFPAYKWDIMRSSNESIRGKYFQNVIHMRRIFDIDFKAITATQKEILKTIYEYGKMLFFYYVDINNASAFCKCEWVNDFDFREMRDKYYGKIILNEVA